MAKRGRPPKNKVQGNAQRVTNIDEQIKMKEAHLAELAQKEKEMKEKYDNPDGMAVPPGLLEVVHTILGPKFVARIVPLDDRPEFRMDIVVPMEYSNLPPQHKEMYREDVRSAVIKNSMGKDGVRAWCEKIRLNLKIGEATTGQPMKLTNQ